MDKIHEAPIILEHTPGKIWETGYYHVKCVGTFGYDSSAENGALGVTFMFKDRITSFSVGTRNMTGYTGYQKGHCYIIHLVQGMGHFVKGFYNTTTGKSIEKRDNIHSM